MNIILVTVLVSIISQTQALKPRCGSSNKADACMQKLLLLGSPKFKFPENMVEMNAHCKNITKYEKCIKDYSQKCLETYPRQVTSVLAFGIAKTNKGYCTNQRAKEAFISINNCGNRLKSQGDKCMRDYVDNLLGTENHSDNKLKVPLACCNYHRMKDCILNLVQNAIPSICNEQNYAEIEHIVDGYAIDTLNLICGDYTEDSDKCESILGQTPAKLSSQKRPRSLLPPFITILSALE